MPTDDAATEKVMKIAQKATAYDHGRRYEEAIYFYVDAANKLLRLLNEKKCLPILRKSAEEYINRAEYLKRELPRLLELAKTTKSHNQLMFEKAEFRMIKAQDLDCDDHHALALDEYDAAVKIFKDACHTCSDGNKRAQILKIIGSALERMEILSRLVKEKEIELLALPDVPTNEFDNFSINSASVSPVTPPTPHKPASAPSTPQVTHPRNPSEYQNQGAGLTKEELAVLATTSYINGKQYVPFLPQDLRENFSFTLTFSDKDGKLHLAEKQKAQLKGWMRPSEIMPEPKLIQCIDSGTIKQTAVSDCSFVSSLAVAARYEKRFGKQIVTSIIYPQNKKGVPVYNSHGKYMIKFHINGVWRKVIIDDYLPVGENRRLLCSHSQLPGELWVSILEKAYMKVMGGYDFPGSNSNIDLHALTGWIPERISISSDPETKFDPDKVFDKLLSRFHAGDCLVTLATGKLDDSICERAGLVDCHAYAVLDLRKVEGHKLLMVKNPWTHLRWKGKFSENDLASWTPSLRKALDYDPNKAKEKDDGVFWIELASVCKFFDVFYVNWNPNLFPFTSAYHSSWHACSGPIKDLYSVADNPQYTLEVHNSGKSAVWILLTRHITEISDFADNKEYITVMVYKSGKKVYLPFDPKPLNVGLKINSPHYLCQMIVDEPGIQKYTLVVAQYEKMNTINYSLRVYSSTRFNLNPMRSLKHKKTITGKWEGITAGGCGNSGNMENYKNNPMFRISLEELSDENSISIILKGPKKYSVGFQVLQESSARSKPFEKQDSGSYRPGYTFLSLSKVPAGVYSIRVTTFLSGQEGPFILTVESSCGFNLTKVAK
ncbi:unnamed protein product [Auanema sp. JU1783]|nr:unnamed protein product [Auanema sp. JU1783]